MVGLNLNNVSKTGPRRLELINKGGGTSYTEVSSDNLYRTIFSFIQILLTDKSDSRKCVLESRAFYQAAVSSGILGQSKAIDGISGSLWLGKDVHMKSI